MLEYTHDLISVVDGDGAFRYTGPSHRRVLGYAPDMLRGTSVFTLLHPDDRERAIALFTAGLQEPGAVRDTDVRVRHADGSWRTLEVTGVNRLDDPSVHGVVITSRDVTDRRRVEAERERALVEAREARAAAEAATSHLQALQAVTDTALAHTGLDDLLPNLIPRITGALGVDSAAILLPTEDGQHLVVHLAHGPDAEVARQLRVPVGQGIAGRVAATKAPLIIPDLAAAVERINTDVSVLIRSLMCVPLLIEQRLIGVMYAGSQSPRDFSPEDLALVQRVADRVALALERARLYAGLQHARAEAERAVQLRDDVLTLALHDLRSPLTSVQGRAQLVQGQLQRGTDVDLDWVSAQLHALHAAASRMLGTLEQMSDIALLQMDQPLVLQCEDVDVGLLVRMVADEFMARSGAPRVEVDVAGAAIVWGDRDRLTRVLHNLIGNAIKYSLDRSPVEVTVRAQDGQAVLTVCDRGVGIPRDELPHIFTRFYRASTATGIKGSGIGLSASKALIEQHGGRIAVTSTVGGGTVVTMHLPLAASLTP